MPVDLSGYSGGLPSGWLLIGFPVFLLLCVLAYLAALCVNTINMASLSNLKSLCEKAEMVEKAIFIKNHAAVYSKRLKVCIAFHAAATIWIFFALYWLPLANVFHTFLPHTLSLIVSGLVMVLLLSALLSAILCMIPEKTAAIASEKRLLRLHRLITFWNFLFLPLSAVGTGLSMLFCRIFFHEEKPETPPDNPTEEKILMMVDEGEINGTIEVNTKSMIENVFDFDDTTVGEIMTHRKDIVAIREDDALIRLKELAIESGRSRIPVYHEDIDDIIGILYVKDLLQYVGSSTLSETIPQTIIHPAVYVPVSKRCSEMFRYMTAHKTQLAVVVDEFGGTAGLITMEDLIESILGNIQDEYDHEDDSIRKVNEYSFQVDGATPLDEIEALTGLSFPQEESDTIAGVMLDRMGHIPKPGEHPSIIINNTRFTVLEVEQRRISRIMVVKNHSAVQSNHT